MDPPESLEKIFLRVEEESQRKAQSDGVTNSDVKAGEVTKAALDVQRLTERSRRRGSVSITRFGQLADALAAEKEPSATSPPNSPAIITTLASQSSFYQAQLLNVSHDSLASRASETEGVHAEDDNHVTQMQRIAGRQTLTRAVGNFIPRRLSRARARPVFEEIDGAMVIGVSVQAATAMTVEDDPSPGRPAATVTAGGSTLTPTLNTKASRSSLRSITSNSNWVPSSNWVSKAKDFTKKLRRKSTQPLTQSAT